MGQHCTHICKLTNLPASLYQFILHTIPAGANGAKNVLLEVHCVTVCVHLSLTSVINPQNPGELSDIDSRGRLAVECV